MNANRQRLTNDDAAAENVNLLLQSVSYSSAAEIECVIADLESLRDALRTEGDRVQRAAVEHAGTSQAAAASMRVVADRLRRLEDSGPR
jgi:hypothetical protein